MLRSWAILGDTQNRGPKAQKHNTSWERPSFSARNGARPATLVACHLDKSDDELKKAVTGLLNRARSLQLHWCSGQVTALRHTQRGWGFVMGCWDTIDARRQHGGITGTKQA